ncbi:MAG: hypothetical protein M3275_15225, partial [Thermoproteota archaeon]|nr:hypothetical protein [Thermoproteota archaeon]
SPACANAHFCRKLRVLSYHLLALLFPSEQLMTDSITYSSFLVRVDIANYVAFFGCPLFERFFSGPRGFRQKNLQN